MKNILVLGAHSSATVDFCFIRFYCKKKKKCNASQCNFSLLESKL